MASINFNAAEVEPSAFEAIPAGTYEAVVSNSESKPMKSGNGMGFNFEFEIVSGEFKGKKVFAWITFEHRTSPDAQRIGREQLSALCRAVGVSQLNDTVQLHNLPLMITVAIDRSDATRNIVKGYKAKAGAAAQPAQTPAAPAQDGGAATGAAPWAR